MKVLRVLFVVAAALAGVLATVADGLIADTSTLHRADLSTPATRRGLRLQDCSRTACGQQGKCVLATGLAWLPAFPAGASWLIATTNSVERLALTRARRAVTESRLSSTPPGDTA